MRRGWRRPLRRLSTDSLRLTEALRRPFPHPPPDLKEAEIVMSAAAKKRPRTKPSGERRDDLMNAALTLFLANGVAPTTIEQITAGADVAKGTFYLHVAS